MTTWIALFRGINVGGNNILPMAALRELLGGLGLANPRTYIQSGNALFESKAKAPGPLAAKISAAVEAHHGFCPKLLLLRREDLEGALAANPFPEAAAEPKSLHLLFLAEPPSAPDLPTLEALRAPSEHFRLLDRVFYLHAPDGIGRSKLAAKAEKLLGVVGTGRNLRTADKLLALSQP